MLVEGVVKIADFGLAGVVSTNEATETDAGTQALQLANGAAQHDC